MCEQTGPSIFGQRVKSRREGLRMSQGSLAERARVSASMISRLESGDVQTISAEAAARIARVLGADLNWLLGVYDVREEGQSRAVGIGLAVN